MTRANPLIDVLHFQRRPGVRGFSIERLFDDLRAAMPADIRCHKHIAPQPSQGGWRRLENILDARRHRGPVNHITGDVHYLALGLPGENTVLTIHDCGILHRARGLARRVYQQFWYNWPIARCRIVTAISEATRRELVELTGAPPEKIRVIYDCVSAEFVPVPAEFNRPRPRLLLIGVAPNKNLARIAAALAGLACTVELIGRPSPAQAAAFASHGVELNALGELDNAGVLAAYRRCDLVVFASIHEGFGLPILEAQATGRLVVTSHVSSMAEVAGDSACLVDPFSPASIRAGVDRVIADAGYRAELLRRGAENIRRFQPARIAAEYAAVYRELAGVPPVTAPAPRDARRGQGAAHEAGRLS
jgi:glycosyltransferase involved in cell wall biosynthesis